MIHTVKRSALYNYLYSLGLQFFKVAAPIIVIPYVYRQITPYEMGLVNLTITIMTYFYITGDLGTYIYGFKEVSLHRNDKERLNRLFSELFFFRLFFNIIIICAYIIYILYFYKGEVPRLYFWIAGIQLLSTFFSVEWFFEGNELFKFVSLKTILIRSIFLIMTLFLVRGKHASEYYLFTLCGFLLFNNIISFIILQKSIKWKFKDLNIFRHTKSMIIIFVMINWSMLYFQFDKLFLGYLNNYVGVSYYTLAERIALLSSSIVFSFVTIMTPRLGEYLRTGFQEYKYYLGKVFTAFLVIAIPISSLVYVNSKEIVLVLGGKEYLNAAPVMNIFSFFIIFYLFLELLKANVLLLLNKEAIFFFTVISFGVINVIIKLYFKIYDIEILSFVTLITSIVNVTFLMTYVFKKFDISIPIKDFAVVIISIVLVFILSFIDIGPYIWNLAFKSSLFLGIYICILICLKNEIVLNVLKKIKIR